MTKEQKIIRAKLGLLELAKQPGLSGFPCAGGGLNITPQWLL